MRPTLKVSRLDPEFIHSRKSNEGEKFTTKWPVNFKRFTRMIKIGGLNLPIGKNVLRFIRRGRKKCPKIAVKNLKKKSKQDKTSREEIDFWRENSNDVIK